MSKHTAGPWSYAKRLDGVFVVSDPRDEYAPLAYLARQPEAEANARLIAAAPEMWDVVKAACAYDDAIQDCADDPQKMASF